MLSRVLSTHGPLVPGSPSTLPEPLAFSSNDTPSAEAAGLDGVVLFTATPPTDHPVRPFVDMIRLLVMATITRENTAAAREAEPPVRLAVVRACSPAGQRISCVQAKLLLFPARTCGRRGKGAGCDEEELDFGNLEGEVTVTVPADVCYRRTSDRDEAGARCRTSCASWDKGAW